MQMYAAEEIGGWEYKRSSWFEKSKHGDKFVNGFLRNASERVFREHQPPWILDASGALHNPRMAPLRSGHII